MRSLNVDYTDKAEDLIEYVPQDDFLKLLMCGDGSALGFRFGIPLVSQSVCNHHPFGELFLKRFLLVQYGKWVWDLKNHIDQMFMDLFKVDRLLLETKRGKYDTSQYDSLVERHTQLNPEDAAILLQSDDGVDFQDAWNVLRDMIASNDYKEEVLSCISSNT